jgi:hypothetical protein
VQHCHLFHSSSMQGRKASPYRSCSRPTHQHIVAPAQPEEAADAAWRVLLPVVVVGPAKLGHQRTCAPPQPSACSSLLLLLLVWCCTQPTDAQASSRRRCLPLLRMLLLLLRGRYPAAVRQAACTYVC